MQTWRRSRRHLPPVPFRRGAFVAWGPRKGYSTSYSLREAARRTAALGYEWVALLLDDSGQDQDSADTGAYNRQIYSQWQDANHAEGLLAGCWFTQGGNIYLTPPGSDFAIAEVEGPGDYDGVVYALQQGWLPTCSLAVVTNFSTITRDRAKVLIDAGFACLPEAYANENPNQTPDQMDRVARNLGWPTSQPVAGVYPNPTTGVHYDYSPWASWPLADYLLEYVI